jgi:PAS domain S-box-containing protein
MVKGRTPRRTADDGTVKPARKPSARGGKRGAVGRDWAERAVDAAPTLILAVDRNGIIRSCNPACAAWWRHAATGLVGESYDVFADSVGFSSGATHAKLALAGEACQFNALALRSEAGVRMVEATYAPHRAKDGTVEGFIAYLTDVTDRERSASQHRGGDEKYRTVLDSLPTGVLVESHGKIEYANDAVARVLERPAQSGLVGSSLADLLSPSSREAILAAIVKGEPWSEMPRWLRADGNEIATTTAGIPIAWSGQAATLLQIETTSARRAVDVVPQFTKAHYQRLVDLSPDPLYVHRDGRIVMVNAAVVRLFGATTPDQLIGRHAFDLVHPDEREIVGKRIARTVGEDAMTTFVEQRRLRLDGSEFVAQIAATPIVLDGQRGGIVMVRDITEQRRAERKLRESELRFRLLAEVSFDAILEIENGIIRDVYGHATDLFGYNRHELIGKAAKDTAAPQEQAKVDRRIAEVVEGTHEALICRKDGTIVPVELSAKHFVRDGLNIRMTAMRDISERKRADAQLRESEERFRHLAEASFDAALVLEDGIIRDVNGRALELYGYSREELIGRQSTMLAAPNEVEKIKRRIGAAVEGTFDTAIQRKSGEIVSVEVSTKHFVRDGRNVRISAMRDITERKRIENQLRESEARFRRLFEMFPYAIYVHVDDKIVFVNRAAAELFGYDAVEDMLGTSALALYHPEARDYLRRRRAELLLDYDDTRERRSEFQFLRRDGTIFDGEGVAAPALWAGQRALIVIVCDVSERKKFIAAITAAKEAAELANRSKTEFLATVSHELRTPLNAIIGFSDLMVNELLGPLGDEAYKTYAADIMASGRHLLAIINDILDISKIEAGKLELADEPFSPREVLLTGIKFVEGRAREKSIELTWRAASSLPRLRGDEQKFRQILTNLLSNAVKFTPERGSVAATAKLAADGSMVIAVADTGIGIAPGDIEKALTPFVQIESGLDRTYEGTGLGLPIAKSLAEMHGGSLEIESAPGRGTTVTVRLPPERVLREPVKLTD